MGGRTKPHRLDRLSYPHDACTRLAPLFPDRAEIDMVEEIERLTAERDRLEANLAAVLKSGHERNNILEATREELTHAFEARGKAWKERDELAAQLDRVREALKDESAYIYHDVLKRPVEVLISNPGKPYEIKAYPLHMEHVRGLLGLLRTTIDTALDPPKEDGS